MSFDLNVGESSLQRRMSTNTPTLDAELRVRGVVRRRPTREIHTLTTNTTHTESHLPHYSSMMCIRRLSSDPSLRESSLRMQQIKSHKRTRKATHLALCIDVVRCTERMVRIERSRLEALGKSASLFQLANSSHEHVAIYKGGGRFVQGVK